MSLDQNETRRSPDDLQPDTRNLVWKDRSKTALRALVNAVSDITPLILLTGGPGAGKTTFLDAARTQFGDDIHAIDLNVGDGSPSAISKGFSNRAKSSGSDGRGDQASLIATVSKELFDLDAVGKKLVLLIDDGDVLQDEGISLLLMIASIQRKKRYLPRIIVAGSSDLFDRFKALDKASDAAVIDAISVPAMARDATFELIRNEVAQHSDGKVQIDDGAAATVYRETNGVPGPTIALVQKVLGKARQERVNNINMRNIRDLLSSGDDVVALSEAQRRRGIEPRQRPETPPTSASQTPKSVNLTRTTSKPSPSEAGTGKAAQNKTRQNKTGQSKATTGETAAKQNPSSDLGTTPDQLPKSIRESDDPQQLLRWAMGVKKKPAEKQSAEIASNSSASANLTPTKETPAPAPKAAAETPPVAQKSDSTGSSSSQKPAGSGLPPISPPFEPQQPAATQPEAKASSPEQLPKPKTVSDAILSSEQFVFSQTEDLSAKRGYIGGATDTADKQPMAPLGPPAAAGPETNKRGPLLFGGGLALGLLGAIGTAAVLGFSPIGQEKASPVVENGGPGTIIALTNPMSTAQVGFGNHPGLTQGVLRRVPADLPRSARPLPVTAPTAPSLSFTLDNRVMALSSLSDGPGSESLSLERQSQATLSRTERLSSELASLEGELLAAQDARAQVAMQTEQSRETLASVRGEIEVAQSELARLTEDTGTRRTELSSLLQDLASGQLSAANVAAETDNRAEASQLRLASLIAQTAETETNLTTARQLLNTLNGDIETARGALASLEDRIARREVDRAELETKLAVTNGQRTELERGLSAATEELATARANFSTTQTALRGARSELDAATAGSQELNAQLGQSRAQLASTNEALALAKSQLTGSEAQAQTLGSEIEALQRTRTGLRADIATLTQQFDVLSAKVSGADELRETQTRLAREVQGLTTRLDELRQQESDLMASLEQPETRLQSAQNQQTRGEEISQEIADAADELAQQAILQSNLRAELSTLVSKNELASSALSETQEELRARNDDLVALRKELAALVSDAPERIATQLPSLRAQTARGQDATENEELLTSALESAVTPATDATLRDLAGQSSAFVPRDAQLVGAALGKAPGLSSLSSAQMTDLQTRIEAGECLTDALKASTGTINRHTLAVLLRSFPLCSNG